MLFSELLKNPCLHRPWPPRIMLWYVIGYLETSEYLLSGGGGDGRVLGESHGFQWKRRGAGESSPTEYDDWGGGTIGTN